jgi:hypothetical protein
MGRSFPISSEHTFRWLRSHSEGSFKVEASKETSSKHHFLTCWNGGLICRLWSFCTGSCIDQERLVQENQHAKLPVKCRLSENPVLMPPA